jgi:hypothetical protein
LLGFGLCHGNCLKTTDFVMTNGWSYTNSDLLFCHDNCLELYIINIDGFHWVVTCVVIIEEDETVLCFTVAGLPREERRK